MLASSKDRPEKRLLRLEHAAELYDIPRRTLREYCLRKKIAATMIRSRWYVLPETMDKLAKEGLK